MKAEKVGSEKREKRKQKRKQVVKNGKKFGVKFMDTNNREIVAGGAGASSEGAQKERHRGKTKRVGRKKKPKKLVTPLR